MLREEGKRKGKRKRSIGYLSRSSGVRGEKEGLKSRTKRKGGSMDVRNVRTSHSLILNGGGGGGKRKRAKIVGVALCASVRPGGGERGEDVRLRREGAE